MNYQYINGADSVAEGFRKTNENFQNVPDKASILNEANSYTDTKKTEAVNEVKEWSNEAFSNPNLLINGDFRVWQRGTEISQFANTNKYTADRWICGFVNDGKTHTFKKHANGIMSVEPNGGYLKVRQVVQIPDSIRGKKVCLSVCVRGKRTDGTKANFQIGYGTYSSGTWSKPTITPKQVSNDEWETFNIVYSLPQSELPYVEIYCFTSNPIYIKWVKLELGEVATPFVPRTYAEELAMCQRYFYALNSTNTGIPSLGIAVMRTSTLCLPTIWLPVPMRAIPTLTYSGFNALIDSGNYSISSITIQSCAGQAVSLRVTLETAITIGKAAFIQGTNSGENNLYLDAEIY